MHLTSARSYVIRAFSAVIAFAGSILSGINGWSGICESCRNKKKGRWKNFGCRVEFVIDLQKRFSAEVCYWKEYNTPGAKLDFSRLGGNDWC
jgi:hypothetical protein